MRPLPRYLGWLLLLAGCGQPKATEQPAATLPLPAAAQLPTPAAPAVAYTSGDWETTGLHDTLHVGRDVVLRLVPGSKSDFPAASRLLPFSEARLIRQQGEGRVRRRGSLLEVRPYAGLPLQFVNTRHDQAEELDVRCTFMGSLPGRPYWIIDSLQWERFQPFLVQKYSGHSTLLTNDPETSPNRNFLFVATPGLDSESTSNLIELLAISDQAVTPIWTRIITHWQPQRAHWLDNHTIAIEQFRFESKQDTSYVRLLLPY